MKSLAIGLDVGTSAVKAGLFDGSLARIRSIAIDVPTRRPDPNIAEQDLDHVVSAVLRALEHVTRGVKKEIAGVGLACHRSSIVPFDPRNREALGPIVLWNDRRASAISRDFGARARRSIEQRTGLPLLPYFAAPRMKWLLEETSLPRHARLLTVDAALALVLGAKEPATDPSLAARTLLADRCGRLAPELLRLFGIPRSRVADVRPTLGLRARLTMPGLPRILRGVPLVASVADQSAAFLGLSHLTNATTTLTIGTGLFAARRGGRPDPHRGVMPLVFEGDAKRVENGVEANDPSSGATIQAFCELFELRNPAAIDRLAAAASNAPILIPSVTGLGAPWLVPTARGAILEWSPNTTRADLAGGLLDGIAARAAELLALVGDRGPVACGGGGAASDELLRRIANRSGRTLLRVTTESTTALGAAVLAWRALGHEVATQRLPRAALFESRSNAHDRRRLAREFAAHVRRLLPPR